MKRYFMLMVLNFLLLSCTTTQSVTSSKVPQFILDSSQYSTEKGKSLAHSYQKNIKNIFHNINAKYKGISFTPVTRTENGRFTGGIGFFREEVENNDEDHRYLGIRIGAADIFYLDNDSPENRALRVETIYTKYIRELLKIMTDEKEILANDDVEGFSIRIAWVSKSESLLTPSRYVDDLIVKASKSDAYDYSHKEITTQDFLSRSDVLQFSQNMSMEKINVKVASLSKTSVAHISPLPESKIIGTLDKDSEVIIHSYKDGFFGFPDNSAFLSKENFILTGFLESLIEEYGPEIANKKNELESEKKWIESSVANVRESNTTSSPVIGKLKRGDHVFIQEERNNWYRVYYSEPNDASQFSSIPELIAAYKKGWINKKLLSSIKIDRLSADEKDSIPIAVDAQTVNIEKKKPELVIADKKSELESEKKWIESSAANVRESNNTSSPAIDILWRGDHVFIQEESNDWYRVYYSEPNDASQFSSIPELIAAYKKGWINKNLLSSIKIDRLSADEKDSIPIAVDAQTGNIEKQEPELEISNKKNELESEKKWIESIAANVRETNTTSSPAIDILWRGDHVFIQEENNNWYRVYYSEPNDASQFSSIPELIAAYKKGWIYKKLLSSIKIDRLSADEKDSIPIAVDAQTGNVEYYIQVSAWKSPDHAQEILIKLKQYYPEAYITEENNFHKVRIPGIMNKKQGADISKDIEEKFNLKPIVVLKIK